jgi:ABC-type amino acid transport substrate-binding protein
MTRQAKKPGCPLRPHAARFFSLFVFLLAAVLFCGCGKEKTSEKRNFVTAPGDFNSPEHIIGVVSETSSCINAKSSFPQARFREYEAIADAYPDLENGAIDAIAFDRPTLEYASRTREVFALMQDNYAEGHVSVAVSATKPELLQSVNAFLREYFASGLYDSMYARWIKSNAPEMPMIPAPVNPYGKLVVGTEDKNEPMNFTESDGSPSGFDIELIYRLAAALNMSVEIKVMPYHDLYTAVEESAVDIAVAAIDKLDMDKRGILFSEDYIDCPAAIMTRKELYRPSAGNAYSVKTPQELAGNYAAILAGSKYAAECKELLPQTKFVLADSRESACSLLISKKIDSMLMEEPLARSCIAMYPEIQIASVIKRESYSFAMPQGSPLHRAVNRIISELKDTGMLGDLAAKWCSAEPDKQVFETLFERDDAPRVNGILRYATTPGATPLCFMNADGAIVGLEIEIMRLAAHEFGMEFQVIPAPRDMLLDLLRSGQIDIAGGMLTLNEGNTENIEFSESYYEGGATLVTGIPHDEYVFGITKLNQLAGKRVGVLPFTYAASQLDEKLPEAIPFYASQERDLFYLLGTEKIDAFMIAEPRSREFLPNYPQFIRIPEFVTRTDYAFFFPVGRRDLSEAFSRQIRAMKKNGMLKALQSKWMSPANANAVLPQPDQDAAPNGVLRMGVTVDRDPFAYIRNEQLVGYDLETAQRAAAAMGFLVEFVRLNSDEFEQALVDGRVDFIASEITTKNTSSGKLVFSEPHYNGGIVVVVPDRTKSRPVHMAIIPQIKFFLKEQGISLYRSLWKDNHMRQILGGFKTTLIITATAVFFGTILGIPLCMLRQSPRKRRSVPAGIVCTLLYNIPILILLMGLHYVVLRRFGFQPLTAAIVIFILRFMAATCRLYMLALQHIGGVQLDAARALCMRRATFFRRIIIPQAAAFLAKPFREEIVRLVELTTVVGYISVWDLTKVVAWIRGRTYESFFPIMFATLLYFLLSMFLIAVISLLSKRFESSVRRQMPVSASVRE